MSKKVIFSKPSRDSKIVNAEDWIKNRELNKETITHDASTSVVKEKPTATADTKSKDQEHSFKENINIDMKRITLDIPKSWHKQIKIYCAEKEVKMSEEILHLLKKHFFLKD